MSAQNPQDDASNGAISIVTNIINIITISNGANNSALVRVRTVTANTTTINFTAQPAPNQLAPNAPEVPNDDAPDGEEDDAGSNDREDDHEHADGDDLDYEQFPSSPLSARCPDSDDSQVRYGELEDDMTGGRLTLPQKKKEKGKQDVKVPKSPARWPKYLNEKAVEQVGGEKGSEKAAGPSETGATKDGDAGENGEDAEQV